MKKTLLFLSALLMSVCAQAQTAYKTLTFPDDNSANNANSSYTETWTAIIGEDSWTIENFNNNKWNNWTYIRCGSNKNASVASIASPAIDQPISTVVVTIDKINEADNINSIQLVVASDADFTTTVETLSAPMTTVAAGDLTFTVTNPAANEYYKLVFDCAKCSKNGNIQLSKVVYNTNGTVETKKAAGLAFSEAKVSVEQGAEFTPPTFTKETSATVAFTSSNERVAKVSADGVIELGDTLGTATITATSEANDEYEAGTATTTIEVYALNHFVKATTFEAGKSYLFVAERNDSLAYAYPQGESKTYGYLYTNLVSPKQDTISIKSSYDDTFLFTAADEEGSYYIQDCYGRYLYHQSGTYNTFNFTDEKETASAWTVAAQEDGTYKIAQTDGYYVQWGDGKYTSFGLYNEAREKAVLPQLYELYVEPVEPEYPYEVGDTVIYRKDFAPAGEGFTIVVNPIDWENQYLYVSVNVSDKRTQDILSVGPEGKSANWDDAIHNYLTTATGGNQTVWYYGKRANDDNDFVAGSDMTIEISKANGYVVNGEQRIAPENLSALFALETVELSDQEANGSQTSTSTYHVIALYPVDKNATGIDAVQPVVVNENAAIYNLAGQRVGKDYKGIVVVGGKKLIRK